MKTTPIPEALWRHHDDRTARYVSNWANVALHLLACFADGHPQITEELQLPVFERGPNGSLHARPPSRPLDPPLSARARFYRRYSAEWWQVNE